MECGTPTLGFSLASDRMTLLLWPFLPSLPLRYATPLSQYFSIFLFKKKTNPFILVSFPFCSCSTCSVQESVAVPEMELYLLASIFLLLEDTYILHLLCLLLSRTSHYQLYSCPGFSQQPLQISVNIAKINGLMEKGHRNLV